MIRIFGPSILYFFVIIFVAFIRTADGIKNESKYASFHRDYLLKINTNSSQNVTFLRTISFKTKNGLRDSVDLIQPLKSGGIILVPRDIFPNVKKYCTDKGINFTIVANNLDRKIKFARLINKQQYFRSVFSRSLQSKMSHYMRFEEMKQWLREKAKSANSMELETIGTTEENREIILVKMSQDKSKPIIWVDGGIHAREWISPSTALYFIDKLLENSEKAQTILKNYQVYVVPLINPDGYEYTHKINRLWRKNRVRTHISECVGVDLNRNFPYHWGGIGASEDPCSRIYRGGSPQSEKETVAIVDKLTSIKQEILLFVTLHSFGQYIMSPYGYSRSRYPRHYYKLMKVGSSVSTLIRETYGRFYQVGSSANLLYEASGASDDYAAGELKIPFTYTIELPDRGRYGFLLPSTYIKSVGNQFWDGLNKFLEEIDNKSFTGN